jgi:hypothetical protein
MKSLKFALTAAALSLSAMPAHAVITAFGGGTTGTDPLGHTWLASNMPAPAWGIPGLGEGTLQFNLGGETFGDGLDYATAFTFVLLLGPVDGIDFTPPSGAGGFEATTRFSVDTGSGFVLWDIIQVSPQQVRFEAPTFADRIKPGDSFFVNVAFTSDIELNDFAFAGLWSNTGIIPEPATWAMMIAGFGLVGFALRRRAQVGRITA